MRNPTFDIMKGIGIIAMIIGHCMVPFPLYVFIFAWHMPLFFIVSGYFFRRKPIVENFKGLVKSLLIPYAITASICVASRMVRQIGIEDQDYITPVLCFINGAGSKDIPMLGRYTIGSIWFLLAMFWCRFLYNILSLKVNNNVVMGGAVLSLSIIGVVCSRWLYLPSDMLQGVVAMTFFHVGVLARRYEIMNRECPWWYIMFMMFLIVSILCGRMEMSRNLYACFPINALGAVGATFLLYKVSEKLTRYNIGHFLAYVGSISLLILCVHAMDGCFIRITDLIREFHSSGIISAAVILSYKFIWVIIICWLSLRSSRIKEIFYIR